MRKSHADYAENVRNTKRELRQTPEVKAMLPTSKMMLVGVIYDIESGSARFLD